MLYQPYTLQNNTYLGVPSAYSWTLGVTATIPLYNRNQGNVTRAKINITQTEIQVASAERGVMSDVLNAAAELEQSLVEVTEFKKQILPDSKKVLDAAYRRFTGGQTSASIPGRPARLQRPRPCVPRCHHAAPRRSST